MSSGYGAPRWLRSTQIPFAAAVHHHHRPHKRGHSLDSSGGGISSYCGARGSVHAPNPDRRVWYNPERSRWRRKRHRPSKPIRHWIEADNLSSSSPSPSSSSSLSSDSTQDRFILLSYNVLGDNNASNHEDLYVNIPFDVLRWDKRKPLICQEIYRWNADIVCLQEVDRYNDILTNVKKGGYAGSYKRRTGEAKDGCAIFWKEKRFRLLEEETIEFTAFGLRDNVAQLLVFEVEMVLKNRHRHNPVIVEAATASSCSFISNA